MFWKIIEIIALLLITFYTSSILVNVLERKEVLERSWRKPAMVILLLVGGLSFFSPIAAISLMFFFVFAVGAAVFIAEKDEDKRLFLKLGKLSGRSATFAIIANLLREVRSFKSEQLIYLVAPALFYLVLAILSRKYKEKQEKERNFDFVAPLIITVVMTAGVVLIVVFMNSKGVI